MLFQSEISIPPSFLAFYVYWTFDLFNGFSLLIVLLLWFSFYDSRLKTLEFILRFIFTSVLLVERLVRQMLCRGKF